MKGSMHSFICILSVVAFASCASAPVAPIEDRSMQKVHEIGLTKNEIYDLSLEWMPQGLLDSSELIEYKDKDKGKIIAKGLTSFKGRVTFGSEMIPCRFTMILEARDNTYRTTYTNFIGRWGKSYIKAKPVEEKEYIDAVKAKLAIVDDSLYKYLNKHKSGANW
jgi:hypothetical protein